MSLEKVKSNAKKQLNQLTENQVSRFEFTKSNLNKGLDSKSPSDVYDAADVVARIVAKTKA